MGVPLHLHPEPPPPPPPSPTVVSTTSRVITVSGDSVFQASLVSLGSLAALISAMNSPLFVFV